MGNGMGQRHFPSFPLPAEGETVFSLFTRCGATSGFLGDSILRELTGQKMRSRLLAPLPAYLPTIARNLQKNHPFNDPLNVIKKNSMLPYLTYFMPASKRAELEEKVARTDVTQRVGLGMGLAQYPTKIMGPPRYCPSCIDEGLHEVGFPYFRREHQLPGVYFCWRHRQFLYHGCTRCGTYPLRNQSLTLAGQCNCDTAIEPLRATSMDGPPPPSLLWLAEQSASLLNSSGTRFRNSATVLGRKAASEASNRQGTADYHSVACRIMERFGEPALDLLNVKVFSGDEPAPWIRRFFYERRGHRPTLLYMLLVGAYFESVDDFELEGIESVRHKGIVPSTVVTTSAHLEKHRAVLLTEIEMNRDITRSDFQKKFPGTYDYLIRKDKQFFQSQILRTRGKSMPRRGIKDWATIDMIKANELQKLFDNEFNKCEKPAFVTKTSALKHCKIFTRYCNDRSRFPKCDEILSARLEDRETFHKRRLIWAVSEMKRTSTPISANRLRRVANLQLHVLHRNRDAILAAINEIGAEVDVRSFLER